jgi:hypothetical protein
MTDPTTRVHLEELEFLRLTSTYGEIFETDVRYRGQLDALHAEAKRAVAEKQQAFDAVMQRLATAHGFDAAKATQWDKDTCDLLLAR